MNTLYRLWDTYRWDLYSKCVIGGKREPYIISWVVQLIFPRGRMKKLGLLWRAAPISWTHSVLILSLLLLREDDTIIQACSYLCQQIIHTPFHSAHCRQHLCDLKRFLYPTYKDEQPGGVMDITGLFQAKGGKSKLAAVFQIFFNVINLFYYSSLGKAAFSNVSLSQGTLVQRLHQKLSIREWLDCSVTGCVKLGQMSPYCFYSFSSKVPGIFLLCMNKFANNKIVLWFPAKRKKTLRTYLMGEVIRVAEMG